MRFSPAWNPLLPGTGFTPLLMNYHTHIDLRSLRYHELDVEAFQKDPVAVRQKAIANLDRWKARGVWSDYYSQWEKILKASSDTELIAIMLEKSAQGDALRQTSPFVGNITEEQRMAVLEQYRRVWEGEISYEEAKKLTASER